MHLPAMINSHHGQCAHQLHANCSGNRTTWLLIIPNLQNIPIRTIRGKEIRKAFIPRSEEYTILSSDYSQVELRIIAALSNDENMCEAFMHGEDIHKATAAKVFGVPIADVSKDMRSKAKAVNFGIIYGQGAFGLAQNLGISSGEAKEIIESYFQTVFKLEKIPTRNDRKRK
jgi:DNA polymerase-1